jgi:hypothetical protein
MDGNGAEACTRSRIGNRTKIIEPESFDRFDFRLAGNRLMLGHSAVTNGQVASWTIKMRSELKSSPGDTDFPPDMFTKNGGKAEGRDFSGPAIDVS